MAIFKTIVECEEKGIPCVLCSILESHGAVPRRAGSRMLLLPDGKVLGTIGGGEIESRVKEEAIESIKIGKPKLLKYDLVDPEKGDPGICGGNVLVSIEPILPVPTLLIIGCGHVGKALANLGKWMGYRVLLSDDRKELCSEVEIPDADGYYPISIEELKDQIAIDEFTSVLLLTRSSEVDVLALPWLLKTSANYIGVIGSKRRWMHTCNLLEEVGIDGEAVSRVTTPVGLNIAAETPEEIAVSIAAQLILNRSKKKDNKESD